MTTFPHQRYDVLDDECDTHGGEHPRVLPAPKRAKAVEGRMAKPLQRPAHERQHDNDGRDHEQDGYTRQQQAPC